MAALTEKFVEQTPSRHLGHVRVDEVRGDGLRRLAALDAVRDLLEGVGRDRVEHRVHEGHVLGRADGAELEAVAAVGEGRRAVAVLRGDLHVAHALDAHGEIFRFRFVLAAALGVGREVLGHVVAEVGRDDRRRRLAGTEPEVVTRRANSHSHQIAVLVNGRDDGGHDRGEGIITSSLRDLADVEEVDAVVRADRPVVVLARAVDVVERLLLEEGGEAVLGRGLLDDLHHDLCVNQTVSQVMSRRGHAIE